MTRSTPLNEAGFTLYEIVVALIVLAVALHPIVTTLSANNRISTDRRDRLDAERVLRNETALLMASDQGLVWESRAYHADRSGRVNDAGIFEVETRRSVRCDVGQAPFDNDAAPPIAGCTRGGVVVDYRVSVRFPRSAGGAEEGVATHTFSVSGRTPHGAEIGALP